jgi:hypothetical protein
MTSASVSTFAEVDAPEVGGREVLVIMGLLCPLVEIGGKSLKRQDKMPGRLYICLFTNELFYVVSGGRQ